MPRGLRFGIWLRAALFAVAAWLLYFHAAGERGLVGPDEPRYASIARATAESGDWVTPRLAGEPWFEKPALLYWMGAAAIELGVPDDLATRVATAVACCAFLAFFWLRLRRPFGQPVADLSLATLATLAGWVAYGQTGVFDLALSASLGVALLCLLDWVEDERARSGLPWFGAFLGVSVLAKGLVGPALAFLALLPTAFERGPLRTAAALFHPRATGPFLLVAAPWYIACYAVNGQAFFDELIWRHHIQRLYSSELQHVQPFWFYLPVLAAALLPWTPLVAALRGADLWADRRLRLLAAWAAGTLLLFSVSTNKLPGYILPALPPIAVLIGRRLARPPAPRLALTAAAATTALFPVAAAVLPEALADGLPRAWPPDDIAWSWALFALAGAAATAWAAFGRRPRLAAGVIALSAVAGFALLKSAVYEPIDRAAGARTFWKTQVRPVADETCIGDVRRHTLYGLGFYSRHSLERCAQHPAPRRIEGDPPRVKMHVQ